MIQIGQSSHGFRLTRKETVAEIEAEAFIFVHEVTRAELVLMQCEDDNKVFMITFRTPVNNDTGVPHILEHSVLNGSRKYPVKEPFVELIKGSLNTFLNAMTYPDKTVYPVASRNAQDFRNLMDVYLDAVFHPLLSRNTFLQEGWHYAFDDETDELERSGVVYNEMLGAYSDPETLLADELDRKLFPGSPYGNSSGGHPEHIADLTYEQFVDFHRACYHPSNSRIYLYGDLDIEASLAHVQEYLGDYDYRQVDTTIRPQVRLANPVSHTAAYPITEDESTERKTYALRAYLLGQTTDPENYLAMQILSHILCGTQASPLRQALIDSHLGEDCLSDGLESDIFDAYFSIGLKGTDADKVAAMETIIDDTLASLARDGIDPRMVEAAINTTEFDLREANFGGYPQGLVYGLLMQSSWLYNADPLMHLRYEAPLAAIKRQVAAGGYFERMIERYFLGNPHRVTISLIPDAQHETRRLQQLREELDSLRRTMSDSLLAELRAQEAALEAAQLEPDSPEALATLPKLPISCIERQAESYSFELIEDGEDQLSYSEQATNGIAYVRLAFDASGVPQELLPALPLFAQALIKTGTESRSYIDLTQEIGIHTGGVSCSHRSMPTLGNPDQVISQIQLSGKVLTARIPKLADLFAEILSGAALDDGERVREIAHISRSRAQSAIVPSGHGYVSQRLAAYSTRNGMYGELTRGLSQFDYLDTLVRQLDEDPAPILRVLKQLREAVLCRSKLHIHITGGSAELAALQGCLSTIRASVARTAPAAIEYSFSPLEPGEGFIVPSKIQYVGKGANIYQLGFAYDGRFEVLKKLLSRDYLWNKVRVQGNAYGCFASFDILSGSFNMVSYRDPHLRQTLDAFDAFAEWLEATPLDRDGFEKLMIGTFGSIDAPKTPDQKGAAAYSRYVTGVTQEQVQEWRDQVLATEPEDLPRFADLFRRIAREGAICVIGSDEKVSEHASVFSTTRKIFAASRSPVTDDDDEG